MDCVKDIVAQDYDLLQEIEQRLRYWECKLGLSEASLLRHPSIKYWIDRLPESQRQVDMLTAALMIDFLENDEEAIAS
jgi:hypothetical protein